MSIRIGIVGATGLVGLELIKILSEKSFDISEIRLFSSEKSLNSIINYKNKQIQVKTLADNSFNGLHYVFFCSNNSVSAQFVPIAMSAGSTVIDNSSNFRMAENVPLVVPEINWNENLRNQKLFCNPNCSTIIALTALYPLHKIFSLTGFHATTFQAASGYGKEALLSLNECNIELQHQIFGTQLSLNVIPQIGQILQSNYTEEEEKMKNESKKIFNNNSLKISSTCVRVPVERTHSLSIIAQFLNQPDINLARKEFQKYSNIIYSDIPTPLLVQNQDECFVGRLRYDTFIENSLSMFVSCDQIRKGAALNAVQIFEKLIQ